MNDYQGEVPGPPGATGILAEGTMQPTPLQLNRARRIEIQQLDHGYQVIVGCQTMAIESKEKIIANLAAYLNDPDGTEEKYRKCELLK